MPTYTVTTYSCPKCRKEIVPLETKGNACPHCGTYLHGLANVRARNRLWEAIGTTFMAILMVAVSIGMIFSNEKISEHMGTTLFFFFFTVFACVWAYTSIKKKMQGR